MLPLAPTDSPVDPEVMIRGPLDDAALVPVTMSIAPPVPTAVLPPASRSNPPLSSEVEPCAEPPAMATKPPRRAPGHTPQHGSEHRIAAFFFAREQDDQQRPRSKDPKKTHSNWKMYPCKFTTNSQYQVLYEAPPAPWSLRAEPAVSLTSPPFPELSVVLPAWMSTSAPALAVPGAKTQAVGSVGKFQGEPQDPGTTQRLARWAHTRTPTPVPAPTPRTRSPAAPRVAAPVARSMRPELPQLELPEVKRSRPLAPSVAPLAVCEAQGVVSGQ